MNIVKLVEQAKAYGYEVSVDKTGMQYNYTIRDIERTTNPVIQTDRHGLEAFIIGGVCDYVLYCERAGLVPFVDDKAPQPGRIPDSIGTE